MDDIKMTLNLTASEIDEIVAGLKNHASNIEFLANKILVDARIQLTSAQEAQKGVFQQENKKEKKSKIWKKK